MNNYEARGRLARLAEVLDEAKEDQSGALRNLVYEDMSSFCRHARCLHTWLKTALELAESLKAHGEECAP